MIFVIINLPGIIFAILDDPGALLLGGSTHTDNSKKNFIATMLFMLIFVVSLIALLYVLSL